MKPKRLFAWLYDFTQRFAPWFSAEVRFGCLPRAASDRIAITFFPLRLSTFGCGVAAILDIRSPALALRPDLAAYLDERVTQIEQSVAIGPEDQVSASAHTQQPAIADLLASARLLKRREPFQTLFAQPALVEVLLAHTQRLEKVVAREEAALAQQLGRLTPERTQTLLSRLEDLKDIAWCLRTELVGNIERVRQLMGDASEAAAPATVYLFQQINAVLNSIDRQEVRGRDSAGISIMFSLAADEYARWYDSISSKSEPALHQEFRKRQQLEVLVNGGIAIGQQAKSAQVGQAVSVTFTYKVAAEIGSLGDNVAFLRREIRHDRLLQRLSRQPHLNRSIATHTRWASVGAINEPNCHPVDNRAIVDMAGADRCTIHACLNGDIDNYKELAGHLEQCGVRIPAEVTTDTKIIPMQIERYLREGHPLVEAFRRAVSDFEGSHAIVVQTDLAPGMLLLAQRGSGQALFVGLAPDHYMPTSEVYGFIEETADFLKLEGEKIVPGSSGKPTQGQIFVLRAGAETPLAGISAMYYDGTPIALSAERVRHTALTSRDIDRQGFPHYFLKEISEAPASVEKTLYNRWQRQGDPESERLSLALDERIIPQPLRAALAKDVIRRIYFVGQGTAGVAAQACAEILTHYLGRPYPTVMAMKASELSGFRLPSGEIPQSMADTLVLAITQSGTTTDTNRAVMMARERGAMTLAIVNRRDSDITFKVDGVMYTSSGRDIEMSVASTKAFYSQIVAGALLGLFITQQQGARDARFIDNELRALLAIPRQMRSVLGLREAIAASAQNLAVQRPYWAVVGSGPNKAASDEIRIKLSELCYKTISSDFVEDKKHIDLSSEPLIMICAAGTRSSVTGDIVKDTAIFQAHKAAPVVIADAGEERFAPYAADVFHVPAAPEHLAPILNTLVGHLWGYHAALAIHNGSRLLYEFRESLQALIQKSAADGLDVYEMVLQQSFREHVARFSAEFRRLHSAKQFTTALRLETAADLTLLLKYLSGRLPASDFELDFGRKGTARNMLDALLACLSEAINNLSRPVDAIKHQAKTVTVGTSRISEALEGLLFESLAAHGLTPAQLTHSNVVVLRHLQAIVAQIKGSILYRIGGLNLLGEPTAETAIEVLRKEGSLQALPSRVEHDPRLKGTKRIIVRQGNVYIGKGRKDDRSIVIIPLLSTNPATPNTVEHLLLLNIGFRDNASLPDKIKALGGKHEHIQNIVQENSLVWEDRYLELVPIEELFGRSAEKVGEYIVRQLTGTNANTKQP